MHADEQSWLDAANPHEPQRCEAQVRGVIELLGAPPKRVLELGCGAGRLLVPLVREGHKLTGIDRDSSALETCRAALNAGAGIPDLIEADFLQWVRDAHHHEPFDAILCVGNTFMTIADIDDAIDLLKNVKRLLARDGLFILDDLPHDLWPQLAEGNWSAGISEDGSMQLVWHSDDSIFTVRRGRRVNPESWTLEKDDDLYRLWTSGGLRLASRLVGLSEPNRLAKAGLLILRSPRPS